MIQTVINVDWFRERYTFFGAGLKGVAEEVRGQME